MCVCVGVCERMITLSESPCPLLSTHFFYFYFHIPLHVCSSLSPHRLDAHLLLLLPQTNYNPKCEAMAHPKQSLKMAPHPTSFKD